MILRLICPSGHVLNVNAQLAGRKVRCGACGSIMVVPAAGSNRTAAAKPAKKPVPRPAVKPTESKREEIAREETAREDVTREDVAPSPQVVREEVAPLEIARREESQPRPADVELTAKSQAEPPPIAALLDVQLPQIPPETRAPEVAPEARSLEVCAEVKLEEIPPQLSPVSILQAEPAPILLETAPPPPPVDIAASVATIDAAPPPAPIIPHGEPPSPPSEVDVPAQFPTITFVRKPYEWELPAKRPAAPIHAEVRPQPLAPLPPLANSIIVQPHAPMLDVPVAAESGAVPTTIEYDADEPEALLPSELSAKPQAAEPAEHGPPADEAIPARRETRNRFPAWLRGYLPARPEYVPSDAIEPGPDEVKTARQLAAAVATAAVLSLLPVIFQGHANPFTAPPWALWAMLLAMVQIVYAAWLVNAPDWTVARVQMIVSAAVTTIYAMVMTLVLVTPVNHTLMLGLGEVRRYASAWCGLMFLLMAAATWYCGSTSARWRSDVSGE